MKTAMQALRDDYYAEFKEYEQKYEEAKSGDLIASVKLKARMYALRDCYKKAAIAVETEKQQIIDAYHKGQIVMIEDFMEATGTKIHVPENDREDAEQYYKETFTE